LKFAEWLVKITANGPGICEGWVIEFCPPTTNAD
jgi:hypothetical protein